MMKFVVLVWILGTVLSWIILGVHDMLVTKYQPEELAEDKGYKRDVVMVMLASVVPVINWCIFVKFLVNILTYGFPEKEE